MEIDIREFRESDLEEIIRLEVQLFSDPWSREMVLSSCQSGIAWVMETDTSEIIGYLIGEMILDDFSIYDFAIIASYQKQGLGYRFLSFLRDWLREQNCDKIFLEVRSQNQAAIGLYFKAGFQPVYVRRNYYQKPVDDALTMVYDFKRKDVVDEEL